MPARTVAEERFGNVGRCSGFLAEGERLEVIQPVRNRGSLDAAALGGAIGALAGARGSGSERAAAAGVGVELEVPGRQKQQSWPRPCSVCGVPTGA